MRRNTMILALSAVTTVAAFATCQSADTETRDTDVPEAFATTGAFVGPEVAGLLYVNAHISGTTRAGGAFDYVRGAEIDFYVGHQLLGTAPAAKRMTVLDLVSGEDLYDPRPTNLARFLRSLDVDGSPANGIAISGATYGALDYALDAANVDTLDFSDAGEVERVLELTVDAANELPGHALRLATRAEGRATLENALRAEGLWRRRLSHDPDRAVDDASITVFDVTVPRPDAVARPARPVLVTWVEDAPADPGRDVHAMLSVDGGATFTHHRLSHHGARSSFETVSGRAYPARAADVRVAAVGDAALVTWTSTYCPERDPLGLGDGDRFGVTGDQAGHTTHAGEVANRCVWAQRVDVSSDGLFVAPPQQLTSGVRDARDLVAAGLGGVGAAVVWREGADLWYSHAPAGAPSPSALSAPVRVTDNGRCTLERGGYGPHPYCEDVCARTDAGGVCYTDAGSALDGNAIASSPSVALVPFTYYEERAGLYIKSARVALAYDEVVPGTGGQGRRVVYHRFPRIDRPDVLAPGTAMSERGRNARDPRVVAQPAHRAGESDVRAALLYRSGGAGEGAAAQLVLRRAAGGLRAEAFLPEQYLGMPGIPLRIESAGAVPELVDTMSPEGDARGAAAALHGDELIVVFAWTASLAEASAGAVPYDVFVRRSFDGGATWTSPSGAAEPPRNLTRLAGRDATASSPDLLVAPERGEVLLAYEVEPLGGGADDVRVARSIDRGATFETMVERDADTGAAVASHPPLASGVSEQRLAGIAGSGDGRRLFAAYTQRRDAAGAVENDVWLREVDYVWFRSDRE